MDLVFTHIARNVFEILLTYPATLDILAEAMTTLHMQTPLLTQEDRLERELFAGSAHANTLSRHTLGPTPYAAQDLNSQIREQLAVTPPAIRVLGLGTMIIDALGQFNHRCPAAIPTLVDSLWMLTAGRSPSKKQAKDWQLTNNTAHILSMNLRESESTDLTALGVKGLDSLIAFVQTHLISHRSRWMHEKTRTSWSAVQERLTLNLYGIIKELLRIQNRRDTLHHIDMLQAIADSFKDITQEDRVIIRGFNILSDLNMGQNSSPLDRVILHVLRSRWDRNSLTPEVWAKGHRQGMLLHSAGASFNPMETACLIQLTAEVMGHCTHSSYHDSQERARFIQTGSTWLRVLAIDNMSNWSRISILTTELILNTMAQSQDDPTTYGNCIRTLCLLSSNAENGDRVRDLVGVDKIMNLLPKEGGGHSTTHPLPF